MRKETVKQRELPECRIERTDYTVYRFSVREWLRVLAECLILTGGIDYLFYQSTAAFFFLAPLSFFWIRIRKKQYGEKRLKMLTYDFRTALNSLAVSLRAGYSVENAFLETEKDLARVIGKKSQMTREIAYLNSRIRVSVPVEELLFDFADRTGLEDISNFAAVFSSAKRMGGSMVDIIQATARTIGDKIDVEREIDTALAAQKFEQKIMSAMPCAIILYMQIASPGFLSILYGTAFGAAVMTGCLMVYAGAFALGSRIVDIQV